MLIMLIIHDVTLDQYWLFVKAMVKWYSVHLLLSQCTTAPCSPKIHYFVIAEEAQSTLTLITFLDL